MTPYWIMLPLHADLNVAMPQVSAKQLACSRERDFFRWLKLPLTIYKTEVPIKTDAGKSSRVDLKGTAQISMILPSDHLRALHDQGPSVFRLELCTSKFKNVIDEQWIAASTHVYSGMYVHMC